MGNPHRHEALRALIAEDDYLVSELIKGLLEDMGHTVVGEATDGTEAVEMTQSLRPDIVLMDIKMPDMDGLEATRLIHERHPTPVVVLTAHETEELVERASAAGVGAYLIKPPNVREVERAIIVAVARFGDMMELERLNAELQARNEELDTFAHTVAHGLKNPLAHVVGFAETLEESHTAMSEEELRRHLHKIAQGGRRMGRIVESLLLLSTVCKEQVRVETLDMASTVAEAMQRLAAMIETHKAEMILPDAWPTAVGYGPWVEEVWANYLSNAIKYGGRPPRVELGAVAQEDGYARFWVRDDGEGIAPEAQARLFRPFTRLDKARAEGSGLGLSIVRHIVEKLGGQVGVESEAGQGSVFSFTLPGAAG
jgi:signal transduction histidine kinase